MAKKQKKVTKRHARRVRPSRGFTGTGDGRETASLDQALHGPVTGEVNPSPESLIQSGMNQLRATIAEKDQEIERVQAELLRVVNLGINGEGLRKLVNDVTTAIRALQQFGFRVRD